MVEVKKYYLPPTALMPNSPRPLLHYKGLQLPTPDSSSNSNSSSKAGEFHDLFQQNGWQTQWIYRYGPTQRSHYHSGAHECMAVLSGSATIRFGVADTSSDMDANTTGTAREDGGVELEAQVGDVFILPAGTAHKTYNTTPEAEFSLISPGDGHQIAAEDARRALDDVQLEGFTMIGAYPYNSAAWDAMNGGEQSEEEFRKVWTVEKPERDPVLGKSEDGLCGLWV